MPSIEIPAEELTSDTAKLIADLAARDAVMTDRAQLTAWFHRANKFNYDQCDHGTYSGGPSNGEPYAMCERFANQMINSHGSSVHALAAHDAKPNLEVVLAERQRQITKGFDAAHDDAHGAEHLIAWAIDYAARGETVKATALLLALNEHRGRVMPANLIEQPNLDVAVRAAKIAAGLDPEAKYPPMEYLDHLPAELHPQFWEKQVDRMFNAIAPRLPEGLCGVDECVYTAGHSENEGHDLAEVEPRHSWER